MNVCVWAVQEHQDQGRSSETPDVALAESARWRGHGLPEELGTASAPAIHPDYLQPVESGALRRSDPGRAQQRPAEPSNRPSQVIPSRPDTGAADAQHTLPAPNMASQLGLQPDSSAQFWMDFVVA